MIVWIEEYWEGTVKTAFWKIQLVYKRPISLARLPDYEQKM